MSDSTNGLDDDIDRLLSGERGASSPAPGGSRDRVRRRVAATLGIALFAAPAATAAGTAGALLAGAAKWLGAVALAGLAAGGLYMASRPSPPPVHPPSATGVAVAVKDPVDDVAPIAAPPAIGGDPAAPWPMAAVDPAPVVAASSPAVADPARAPSPRRHAAAPPADLAAERLLLDEARGALGRGDSASALAGVEQHARRFPAGQLVELRESLAVRALVAAGQEPQARARAAAFRGRFPGSAYLPVIDAAFAAPRP